MRLHIGREDLRFQFLKADTAAGNARGCDCARTRLRQEQILEWTARIFTNAINASGVVGASELNLANIDESIRTCGRKIRVRRQ
jgi:hypothetical protein